MISNSWQLHHYANQSWSQEWELDVSGGETLEWWLIKWNQGISPSQRPYMYILSDDDWTSPQVNINFANWSNLNVSAVTVGEGVLAELSDSFAAGYALCQEKGNVVSHLTPI